MTVRDFINRNPDVKIEEVLEGYGDGSTTVENALDEEIEYFFLDTKAKRAEIYI